MTVGDEFAAVDDGHGIGTEVEAGRRRGTSVAAREHHAGASRTDQVVRMKADHVEEAGAHALAHAGDGTAAQLKAAACGDGSRIVRESLRVCRFGVGLFVGALLCCDVRLLACAHLALHIFVGSGRLRSYETVRPVFVEVGVHLVLSVKSLERLGLVGRVGLGVVLRDLIGGKLIGSDEALFVRSVWPTDGSVVLDALNVGRQIGEDGALARERVA